MATAAELQILITAKDSASKQLDAVGKSLGALGGVGKVAVAALAGVATVGVGLAAGLAKSITAAADFESAMSAVGAVSGASSTELASLSDKALQLGQDTRLAGIGATDAAQAMQELAAGGVSTQDILEGAAEGALLLASAGGIAVPRAAEIATNALNQFGLSGKQAGHVADLLAGAANASSADVSDLGESLKYVGPIAKGMGLSIDDVVATLAEFGSQGIKGSQAGTALRSILASLAKPSDQARDAMRNLGLEFFDSSGKMKDMGGISEELQTGLSGLTDQQRANTLVTLFGNEALSAATILYGEGSEGLQKFKDVVGIAGSAAEAGAKRNDNLRGSVEQLKSGLETASITLGTAFLPLVRGLVDTLGGAVSAAVPFIQQYGPVLAAVLQQGADAVLAFGGNVGSAIGAVVDSFLKLRDGQITLDQFIGGLKLWVGQIFENLGTLATNVGTALAPLAGKLWEWVTIAAPIVLEQLGLLFAQLVAWLTGTALPAVAAAAGQLATALVGWITTTAIPFLQTNLPIWGAALWDWITTTAVPTVAARAVALATALADWVTTSAIPFLQAKLPVWGAALWDWITGTAVPTVVGRVAALATALTDWVTTSAVPFLQAKLPVWGAALWDWITATAVPTVVGRVVALATALSDWVTTSAVPFLQAKLPVWGAAIWGYITSTAVPTVRGQVIGLANALSDWVEQTAIPQLKAKMPGFTAALIGQIQQSQQQVNVPVEQMGNQLGHKIAEGMIAGGSAAIPAAIDHWKLLMVPPIITLAVLAFQQGQNIGQQLGKGLGEGGAKELYVAIATFEIQLFTGLARIINPVALVGAQIGLGFVQELISAAQAKAGELWAWLGSLPGLVAGAVGDMSGALYQKGVDAVAGLINGLLSGAGGVASAAAGLAALIPSGVSDLLSIRSPSKVMADIGNDVVLGLVKGMDEKQQEAAKKAADVASSIAKAITDTLDALTALGKLNLAKLPSGSQTSGFLGALADFVEKFTTVAGAFEEDVLKAANAFADTAGKAVGVIKTGVEALAALGKFQAPLEASVSAFLASLADFMEKFSTAAGGFEEDGLAQASAFADAVSKVGASVGNALKGLQDLASADWAKSSPTGSAMSWFTHLTASLVANFAAAARLFADDALAEANAFADTAAKVGGAVGSALKGLQDLASADWAQSSPTGGSMAWFTHLVASMVKNFEAASKAFTTEGLAAVRDFADTAGKVVGVIAPAIAGLTGLSAYVSPPMAVVDDFLKMVKYVVAKFGEMSKHLETEGIKRMGDFADAAGKALNAAKTGTDLFKAFDKLVIPSKQAIDNLVIAVFYIVNRFGEMAANLETEGIQKMQDFADAAGKSLTAAKTGADLFKEMEKLAVPSRQAIDNLLEGIKAVVLQMGAIADQIGVAGIQKAQDFATKAQSVFTTFKASLDLLGSLKEFKALPLDAINNLIDGMKKALEKMGELQGAANAFLQQADTFKGTMEEAARKIAAGLALGGQVPSTTGGGGGGTGGASGGSGGGSKRAAGGPVAAGLTYVVGERGPELFVPGVAGTILPNGVGGGGATVHNYYITGNTVLSKDTATQQAISGIVTSAQRRTIGYSV